MLIRKPVAGFVALLGVTIYWLHSWKYTRHLHQALTSSLWRTTTTSSSPLISTTAKMSNPFSKTHRSKKSRTESTMTPNDTPPDTQIDRAIQILRKHNIKGVAWDWDLTAMCVHSQGRLLGSVDTQDQVLKAQMSRHFIKLFLKLEESGVKQAIVTFSDPKHVQWAHPHQERDGTITPVLGAEPMVRRGFMLNTGNTHDESVMVVAMYPALYQKKPEWEAAGFKQPPPPGKEYHLSKFMEETGLKPEDILLIDDDSGNVGTATMQGFHGCHVMGSGFRMSDLFRTFKDDVDISSTTETSAGENKQ